MEMSGTHPQDSMNFSPTIQTPVTMVTTLNNTSTTAVATSPVTTISATALVEILNSVASAVIPNSTLGDHHGNPHLQLQFQLPTTVDKTQTTTDGGEGEGEGQSNDGQKGKEKQPWHYHLGGVRHCRVPLSAEIKEALEVAYVSRIMSKNFRKEGQPEKERIAQLTGLELDKVQEWFKNRRKKDKLIQSRVHCHGTPKGKRGRKLLLPHTISHSTQDTTNHTSLTHTHTAEP